MNELDWLDCVLIGGIVLAMMANIWVASIADDDFWSGM